MLRCKSLKPFLYLLKSQTRQEEKAEVIELEYMCSLSVISWVITEGRFSETTSERRLQSKLMGFNCNLS
ncbi:hypothetical protein MKW98_028971 [Papaver atlanticum]|uniref:Uncharacterized protein n=1 Tax=Papaver atlanticum TaxID=357466 RepID=A0AAD4TLH2_9MAGN|nr:hypothetical protein MKW98_028971 [Papaver atlanticum]